MATLILMDNVLTTSGSMVSGCEGRLLRRRCKCIIDGGRVSKEGPIITNLDQMADRLVSLVRKNDAEAVVMDIDWGKTVGFNGFQIWTRALERGLSLPSSNIVFLTQHRDFLRLPTEAAALGIDRQQIQFKNEQGNDAAVEWLANVLGLPAAS